MFLIVKPGCFYELFVLDQYILYWGEPTRVRLFIRGYVLLLEII